MEKIIFLQRLRVLERELLKLQQCSLDQSVKIIDPDEKLFNRIGVVRSLKLTNTCIYLNIEIGKNIGLYRLEQLGAMNTPLH